MTDACFQMICYCNGCKKALWNFYQNKCITNYMSSVFAPPPQKKISFTGFNSKSHFPSLHVSSKDLQHFTKNLATLRVWAFGHLILVFSLSITKKKTHKKSRWIKVYYLVEIHVYTCIRYAFKRGSLLGKSFSILDFGRYNIYLYEIGLAHLHITAQRH